MPPQFLENIEGYDTLTLVPNPRPEMCKSSQPIRWSGYQHTCCLLSYTMVSAQHRSDRASSLKVSADHFGVIYFLKELWGQFYLSREWKGKPLSSCVLSKFPFALLPVVWTRCAFSPISARERVPLVSSWLLLCSHTAVTAGSAVLTAR